MNNRPDIHPVSSQQAFDEALRQRHAAAVAQVSSRTQAQLRVRRQTALLASRHPAAATPHATTRRLAWPVAASFAALLAVAFGVQMRQGDVTLTPAQTLAIAQEDDMQKDGMNADFADLEENPDLYLWLASSDAVALASE